MATPGTGGSLNDWLTGLGAPTAVPGGGAAAALAGGLAAALVEMVAGMTGARERYAAVHEEASAAAARATRLREEFVALASRDAETFGGFVRALELPAGTGEERQHRERAKAAALRAGADVQFDLLRRLSEIAELGEAMAQRGVAGALGDAATAVFLAAASARSAYWAVRTNLDQATDRSSADRALTTARDLLEQVEQVERRVRQLLAHRVA